MACARADYVAFCLQLWVLLRVDVADWNGRKGREDGWFVMCCTNIYVSICGQSQCVLKIVSHLDSHIFQDGLRKS